MEPLRKAYRLIVRRRRWQLLAVFASTVTMGVVATLGVASITPFMAVIANPDIIVDNRWLAWGYSRFGFQSSETFLFVLGLLTLAVVASSNAVNAFNAWLIARFTAGLNHDISEQLFRRYLEQSYSFFLGVSSPRLAQNILSEVTSVVNGVMQPAVLLMAKAVVAAFLLALLIYVDPLLALIVAVALGVMYGVVYAVVRKRQGKLGRRKVQANSARYRVTKDAFSGIKDVKILGREEHFLRRFAAPSYEYARANASNTVVGQVPRYALETAAVACMLLAVLYLLRTYDDLGHILPIVGLYAFAAYRLMPAVQQIFTSLTTMRFNLAALDDLHADLSGGRLEDAREMEFRASVRLERGSERPSITFDREIRFEGVGFRYPDSTQFVLEAVSFCISKNATVGLVGHTGAGKTTLADLLLGLFEPTVGRILIDDIPLRTYSLRAWRRRIGYVPQQIYLLDDTIRHNIAFGIPAKEIDEESVRRAAAVAHLDEFVSRLPDGYDTVIGEMGVRLSGGQRQRIGIARALYSDPDVLVMDEGTSALDNVTENAVMDAIRELSGKTTLVLIAHRLTTVMDCDFILLMEKGRLAGAGPYSHLAEQSQEFRAMLGAAALS